MFEVFALNVDGKVVLSTNRDALALLDTDFMIMMLIFRLNIIGEIMLPCGTPFS